jgi:hypothetical protein
MRVYVKENYHEVCAGKPEPLTVIADYESQPGYVRYFIEAGEDEKNVLQGLDMLEEAAVPLEEAQVTPPPKPKKEKTVTDEELERHMPESYQCIVHKKEHKKGTHQYAVCFDKNFVLAEDEDDK